MYVGHVGIALGAKRLRPTVWLPALLVAATACDVVQVALGFVGLEDSDQVYSHSVPAALAIAGALALAYYAVTARAADARLVGAIALSHLPADYLTGQKLLWPGGPEVGLLLYDRHVLDFALETAVITAGWAGYRRTLSRRRRHSLLMWAVLGMLVLAQLALNYYDYREDVLNGRLPDRWSSTERAGPTSTRRGDAGHARAA